MHTLRLFLIHLSILLYYPVTATVNEDRNEDEVSRKLKEHLDVKEKGKSLFNIFKPSEIWEVFTTLAEMFPEHFHLNYI